MFHNFHFTYGKCMFQSSVLALFPYVFLNYSLFAHIEAEIFLCLSLFLSLALPLAFSFSTPLCFSLFLMLLQLFLPGPMGSQWRIKSCPTG